MPKIQAGSITMNYEQQGSGESLLLIPYLAADYACYAFQVDRLLQALHLHFGRSARHRQYLLRGKGTFCFELGTPSFC